MINPVFRRETRTTLRGWKIFAAMVVYTGLLFAAAAITLHFNTNSYTHSFDPQSVIYLYMVLTAFQNIIVAIIVPSLTAGSISGERERQTLDLMLLTKMSTLSIVIGKLMSSLLTVLLMIVASLPVFAIVFYYGGVSLFNLFGMVGFTLLFAAMVGSISIFFSTITKKTVVSTVWTYIVLLAMTLGNLIFTIVSVLLLRDVFNPYSGSILTRLLLGTNPGVGFFALLDTQYNAGLAASLLSGMQHMFNASSSSGSILASVARAFAAMPLWALTMVIMALITILAVFTAAKFIKPVQKKRK